ncbi:MAG TPA: UTP--glucose-1-phosphate uridylyltransferase [Candidatus Saccharimonadales bacterium]|jgi:UTP--glucose-1-phosphate uridylyltransferase|nr:UTP--glucose-1-phosphate uridylyltransferase [Candidatus Saccharimonadales bacterium]
MKVRKAVIAAAGMGTRFLPQTKAMPKEMLPLIDKPIIQYIVEELVDAGIEDIVIVTGYHKRSIEDHFDAPSGDLVKTLDAGSPEKQEILKELETIANSATFIYLRQKGPQGNATPLMNAEHLIGNEPFIYTWGDDFIKATPGRFRQMVDLFEERGSSVISCIRTSHEEDYDRYGFAGGKQIAEGLIEMDTIIEKPGKQRAPSNLASVSGYLFTPSIFSHIRQAKTEHTGESEFYIQDVMQRMIDAGETVLAYEIKGGRYYDTGNKLEYLKTLVDFGLAHPGVGKELEAYIRTVLEP